MGIEHEIFQAFMVEKPQIVRGMKTTADEQQVKSSDVETHGNSQIPTSSLTPEEAEILSEFLEMLKLPTRDGALKRSRGEKPKWTVDPTHMEHFTNHMNSDETYDKDSGAHRYIHAAWRLLAIAFQEGPLGPRNDDSTKGGKLDLQAQA